VLKKFYKILDARERYRFAKLFVAILIMGVLEVVGVASIFPFMELISEPDSIAKSSWLTYIYEVVGFTSHRSMFISFGVGIIILIGVTNFFAIFTMWLQFNYAWSTAHDLCMRLLSSFLDLYFTSRILKENWKS